jgi:hypothetical protein
MPPTRALYLDSNCFIEAGWPSISGKLSTVGSIIQQLGGKIYLLDPVREELRAHWLREYRAFVHKVTSSEVFDRLALSEQIRLPSEVDLATHYDRLVRLVTGFFVQAPMTTRNLQELFDLAIREARPFKKKGAGFQDAVILLSAVDHLEGQKENGGAFISKDGEFGRDVLSHLRCNKSNMKIFPSLDKVQEHLQPDLQSMDLQLLETKSALAKSAAEKNLDEIRRYLESNLYIPRRRMRVGGGKILDVRRMDDVKIVGAKTPLTDPHRKVEKLTLTAIVSLTALVEPELISVQKQPRTMGALFGETLLSAVQILVELECEGEYDGNAYTQFKILGARVSWPQPS